MEPATLRWVDGRRHRPVQHDPLPPAVPLDAGDRRQKRLRVWMERVLEQLVRGSDLNHLPQIHHCNPVANVVYDPQVVGDEEISEPELRLKLLEQVDDLGLHRDVQR